MSVFDIAKYFSLMFSLVSVIGLIPLTRNNRNTLILRVILCLINIISVLFLTSSANAISIAIIIITAIFTECSNLIRNYINKNFVKTLRSNSLILKINLLLLYSINAYGLLVMAKAYESFEKKDSNQGEKILSDFTKKVKNDFNWLSNCIIFLLHINQKEIAYNLLKSISIDLSQKHIPYGFLQTAILLYCDYDNFEMAEYFIDYIEEHYYDTQHKYANLNSFLYYYAKSGNAELFNNLITQFPELEKNPELPKFKKILTFNTNRYPTNKKPKIYKFNMSLTSKNKTLPLYVFAGLICLITFIQLIFSDGYSIIGKFSDGNIFPIGYIKFGASVKSLIHNGEWIRLITPIFLHAGLLHLAMNILGLINIGRALIRFFDKYILLFIFIGGAVIGNIVSLFFSDALISVGASGGVFSIFGAFFAYIFWYRKEINKTVFRKFIISFILISVVQIIISSQNQNIDSFAHLGGFFGGVLLTCLSLWIEKTDFKKIYLQIIKSILFLIALSLLVFWPRLYNKDQYILSKEINENGISYSIPDSWEKIGDRYYDYLVNGQIIINVESNEYSINDKLMIIKDTYTRDGKYHIFKEVSLVENWNSIEFASTEENNPFNLYYFCRPEEGRFIEIYLFLPNKLYDEYLPSFRRVLDSIE